MECLAAGEVFHGVAGFLLVNPHPATAPPKAVFLAKAVRARETPGLQQEAARLVKGGPSAWRGRADAAQWGLRAIARASPPVLTASA